MTTPPKIGEKFLGFFVDPEDREAVLGDFEEEFHLAAFVTLMVGIIFLYLLAENFYVFQALTR